MDWRLVLFLAGSVMCAASWNIDSLIAFRVIQGFGAGLIMPLMTSILVAASGGVALGRLVAMVSLPTALGPILGPVVGGIILNWLDWRWLFLVNVPLCIAALILARRIPADRSSAAPLDILGLLLLAPGWRRCSSVSPTRTTESADGRDRSGRCRRGVDRRLHLACAASEWSRPGQRR